MSWNRFWSQEGGCRELIRLALPLILSSSFMTLQLTIDRVLLCWSSNDAVAAAMPAAMIYWTVMALLQNTSSYATTFVAQYVGANRPKRVGPVVWQSIYFSIVAGLGFTLLSPLAGPIFSLGNHEPSIQYLEVVFFQYLCAAALPALLVASANSFFAGRGDSWTVLFNDCVGLGTTALLDYVLILGKWGFPEMGIAGAGLATVIGSYAAATSALLMFFRKKYRDEFDTVAGWRFDGDLFRRLLRFGLPNGLQWCMDGLAFTVCIFLMGRMGPSQLAASNIAFSINMVGIVPMLGLAQAVMIMVGQRLGQDRPDLAERSTWTGFVLSCCYMGSVAICYVAIPGAFLSIFQNNDPNWDSIASVIIVLLRFVAIYSMFDSLNLIFSFALRGAGDTLFVTVIALGMAWPIMVFPTWAAWYFDLGLNYAWGAVSAYVIILAFVFLLRFRTGKWKSMRVIEQAPAVIEEEKAEPANAVVAETTA